MYYGVSTVSLFQNEVFPWCATANIKIKLALKVVASAENNIPNKKRDKKRKISEKY